MAYRDVILGLSGIQSYWALDEDVGAATIVDETGAANGTPGTSANLPILGVAGLLAEGGKAVEFVSADQDYIQIGDFYDFASTVGAATYQDPPATQAVTSNAWTKSSGTDAAALLNDVVRDPTNARTGGDGGSITSSTDEQIQEVDFQNQIAYTAGRTIRIAIYGSGGLKRAVDVQVSNDGGTTWRNGAGVLNGRDANVIPVNGAAGWYYLDVTGAVTQQSHVDGFRVRLICNATAGGGGATAVQVDAIYLEQAGSVTHASFAIVLWLKPTTAIPASEAVLLSKFSGAYATNLQGWILSFFTDRLRFARGSGDASEQVTDFVTNSAWAVGSTYCVVVESDGSVMRAFVNNTQLGSDVAITESLANTAANLRFGLYSGGGAGLDGVLDAIAILNRALTSTERQSIYDAGTTAGPTQKSGTDSGTATEAVTEVAAIPATDAEGTTTEVATVGVPKSGSDASGTDTEAQALAAVIPAPDAGGLAQLGPVAGQGYGLDEYGLFPYGNVLPPEYVDVTAQIPTTDADGAATEAGSLAAQAVVTDQSGSDTELGASSVKTQGSDASGADTESAAVSTTKSGTDASGTDTESASPAAAIPATDASGADTESGSPRYTAAGVDASGADTEAGSLVAKVTGTDSSSPDTEAASQAVGATSTDVSGTITEGALVSVRIDVQESTGLVGETGTLLANFVATDAELASELQVLASVLIATDTNAPATESTILDAGGQKTSSDSAAGSDQASLAAAYTASDASSSSEAGASSRSVSGADAGTGAEAVALAAGISASELFAATELGALVAAFSGGDSALGSDVAAAVINFFQSDQGGGVDAVAALSVLADIADLLSALESAARSGQITQFLQQFRTGAVTAAVPGTVRSTSQSGGIEK